jgi:hypothetical protein
VELLFCVKDLEGEDGEAVDDEAGGFGVERGGGVLREAADEESVELLDEVVALLVEGVDGVLDLRDGGVGGVGVAGGVLLVPEVEVGAVLGEEEGVERRVCCGGVGGGGVPERRCLGVEAKDGGGVECECGGDAVKNS